MIKNAKRYPKRYIATFDSKTPAELLKKKQTRKVHPRCYPGRKGGKRKTRRKRQTRRKKQTGGGLIDLWNARIKYKNTKKAYKQWYNFFNKKNNKDNKNNDK